MCSIKIRHHRTRVLRSFSRMARTDHGPCQICGYPICPGMEYECTVGIGLGGRFYVTKVHFMCPDDWFDDVEDIVRRDEEERRQEEKKESMRKAA